MRGVLGRLFGTDKAIDNLLDKDRGLLARAGGWIGNLHYTEEDRAEAQERTREWGLQQLAALAPFKVVQRILAFAASALWIFVALNVVFAFWVEAFFAVEISQKMLSFALSDYIFWPIVTVYALYFSGGVVESFKRSKGTPDRVK